MEFRMNNSVWTIVELNKNDIKQEYERESGESTSYVYGFTKYDTHYIVINEEMCRDMKRRTLMHELTHCYIAEYVSLEMNEFDDETLCNICANSHDIIHKIVEDYFKKEK